MCRCKGNEHSRYYAVDLFCGVGGLSLGAARAGLKIAAGIDTDKRALKAHTDNFPDSLHIESDIRTLTGTQLLELIGKEKHEIEAVIGGPPCQGFSRIGRRDPCDSRNNLLWHFSRIVSDVRPRFFLLENVPGILDNLFDKLRRKALEHLKGYKILGPLGFKASDFGAATTRERIFYIGYLPDFFIDITESHFKSFNANRHVNVEFALRGLRKAISSEWKSERNGWQRLTQKPKGWFWNKIFFEIPPGVGNQYAIKVLRENNLVSGCIGTSHTREVIKRFRKLPEGAIDRPSRARRLRRKGLCPTIRSGTGPDRGSFQALRPIHPTEHRVITPREAARLQGFPDWFQFDETKWHSFRQIGNSVSPILAEALFDKIISKRKPWGD